jgi:hypothetical protein
MLHVQEELYGKSSDEAHQDKGRKEYWRDRVRKEQAFAPYKSGAFSSNCHTFGVWLPIVDEIRIFEGISAYMNDYPGNKKGHSLSDMAFAF